MGKIRGLKLGRRLHRISRWICRRTRIRSRYSRLNPPQHQLFDSEPISKLLKWGRRLTNGARLLCSGRPKSGYITLGHDPDRDRNDVPVPKGHLAVYVGQKDGDFRRVLVPVIYFNHPLFGDLLREAEEEYGFQHEGGITIPCGYSEFERVQTRIKAQKTTWKPLCYGR